MTTLNVPVPLWRRVERGELLRVLAGNKSPKLNTTSVCHSSGHSRQHSTDCQNARCRISILILFLKSSFCKNCADSRGRLQGGLACFHLYLLFRLPVFLGMRRQSRRFRDGAYMIPNVVLTLLFLFPYRVLGSTSRGLTADICIQLSSRFVPGPIYYGDARLKTTGESCAILSRPVHVPCQQWLRRSAKPFTPTLVQICRRSQQDNHEWLDPNADPHRHVPPPENQDIP